MTVKYAVSVANAMLDAYETAIGATPIMKIFAGSLPANCAAADIGTVLATLTLPSDWMAAASSGSKAKSGTWEDLSADASGTATYYRIYDSGGSTCVEQGTAGTSGTDLILNSATFTAAQSFSITAFTKTHSV